MKNVSYRDLNHMVFEIKNLGCITLEIYIYVMRWFEAVVTYWKKIFFNNFS